MFVVDDGWFGRRNDDTSFIGRLGAEYKKTARRLIAPSKKITDLGLAFGIWVEPEWSVLDSDLYRKHPDWCVKFPENHMQRDETREFWILAEREVQEYIIASMTKVFSSASVSYVKWDMNRTFSDYYSQSLPAAQQGEVAHRYVLGLYRCMEELTRRFPEILFEGCAAGGNRFDPGILCYFPQIWGSDDTDACCGSGHTDKLQLRVSALDGECTCICVSEPSDAATDTAYDPLCRCRIRSAGV